MNAKPGDIWLADLGLAAKTRPVLIVSRHDPDAHSSRTFPSQLNSGAVVMRSLSGAFPFLHEASVANVQGIGSLIEPRLERKLGRFSTATMGKVKDAIRFALEL